MSEGKPTIRFIGFAVHEHGGGATLHFELKDAEGERVGVMPLATWPTDLGTTDGMLARAHREMAAILREWAGELTNMAVAYESR